MLHYLALLVFILAAPTAKLAWFDSNLDSIAISFEEESRPEILNAARAGLEVKIKYTIRFCKRRKMWFDSCSREGVETHSIKLDPLTQDYSVTFDRVHDGEKGRTDTFDDADAALNGALKISAYPFSLLMDERDIPKWRGSKKSYVGIRKEVEFPQSRSTLQILSSIISLGILGSSTIDSGWKDFYLTDL